MSIKRVVVAAAVLSPFLIPQGRAPFRMNVTQDGLVSSSNFTNARAFKMPTGGSGAVACETSDVCSMDYGGEGLWVDEADNAMYVAGYAWQKTRVAKINLSGILAQTSPSNTTLASLPTASFHNASVKWVDPLSGGANAITTDFQNGIRMDGLFVDGSHVHPNYYVYFDTSPVNTIASVFTASKDLTSPGVINGPHYINGTGITGGDCSNDPNCKASWTSGTILAIPAAYQSAMGGDCAATGNSYSIIGRTSSGPNFTSFACADLDTSGTTAINGYRLLGYPDTGGFHHPTLGGWQGRIAPGTSQWTPGVTLNIGAAWLPSTRSIVYAGTLGVQNHFIYAQPVAADADGDPVQTPMGTTTMTVTGTGTTSVSGTRITVPNLNVNSIPLLSDPRYIVRVVGETSPVMSLATRNYVGVAIITAVGNSGTASAYVEVAPGDAFADGLTGKNVEIGTPSVYDPMFHNPNTSDDVPSGHTPSNFPYDFNMWMFDSSDLANVKSGSISYWTPTPSAMWNFTLPVTLLGKTGDSRTQQFLLGGIASDSTHLYVVQKSAFGGTAIINVWDYTAPAPEPTPLGYGLMAIAGLVLVPWPVGRKGVA